MANRTLIGFLLFNCSLSRIPNQSFWIIYLLHDLIASIDTGATTDTHILQAITNINAGWANLHTNTAIYAIPQSNSCMISGLTTTTSWFATHLIVGNQEGILINHHTLKTGVWAHIFAYLLTHKASITPGCKAIKT